MKWFISMMNRGFARSRATARRGVQYLRGNDEENNGRDNRESKRDGVVVGEANSRAELRGRRIGER